jgi:hypothetical protein
MESLSYGMLKVILCRTCTGWVAPAAVATAAAAAGGESAGGWNDNDLLSAMDHEDDEWSQPTEEPSQSQPMPAELPQAPLTDVSNANHTKRALQTDGGASPSLKLAKVDKVDNAPHSG